MASKGPTGRISAPITGSEVKARLATKSELSETFFLDREEEIRRSMESISRR
jgi:hypothetical protein